VDSIRFEAVGPGAIGTADSSQITPPTSQKKAEGDMEQTEAGAKNQMQMQWLPGAWHQLF